MTRQLASQRTPAPTLAAVRLARAQRDLMLRRLRPSGLIVLGILLIIGSRKSPGPGVHGGSLGILAALVATGAGGVAALLLPSAPSHVLVAAGRSLAIPRWAVVAPFVLLMAGSVGLVWLQPGGPGELGVVVLSLAAMRVLPGRRSRGLIVAGCVVIISLALVLGESQAHRSGRAIGADAGLATVHLPGSASVLIALIPGLVCAVVLFTRRLDRDSYQIERLLIELEQAQNAEVTAAALAERQRLAREMHDVLAHSLSGLALQLEGARLLAVEDPSDPRLADTIDRAHHLAKSGLLEARRAIGMLRDEELPGPERLAALVAGFERDSGVPCELTVEGDPAEPGPQARLTVYRVAQEALTNIRKHASAARAQVRLRYEPQGIRLTVENFGPERLPVPAAAVAARAGSGSRDDYRASEGGEADGDGAGGGEPEADGTASGEAGGGGGEPVADGTAGREPVADGTAGGEPVVDGTAGGGYGLAGMRERAELLGGRLTTARSATGFRVELWVPA